MLSAGVTTDGSSTGGKLTEDEIFTVLSNRRRRYVIHALKRTKEPLDVSELSTHVTAWELDVDPEEVTYEDRRNVYSTLQRTHLPKLEEKDIVDLDEETNLVEPTPELRNLEIYVEVLGSREIPWSLYYLGLTGVAAALLSAVATGTPGFAVFSALDIGVFIATTFGVSAMVHYAVGRRARLGNTEKPPEVHEIE
ncbi:transcriptional regulator [Halobacteriales archaeon SW_8_68_21]|nr:MAG: transcriptional regulator [Halobacteriales archaeon SW_8_68_21]